MSNDPIFKYDRKLPLLKKGQTIKYGSTECEVLRDEDGSACLVKMLSGKAKGVREIQMRIGHHKVQIIDKTNND